VRQATVLLDTGPLVAFLQSRETYHSWAVQVFGQLQPPFHTCEPVLTEACFLMRKLPGGTEAVLGLVELGWIQVSLDVTGEVTSLKRLMIKYASMPMSLADACLVRMSERQANSIVLTLDRDFAIYRRHGRQAIPLITPKRK
jgi:uncharacterized protein